MATASLWPDFSAPPRAMRQILADAAGDIQQKTNGVVQFYVEVFRADRGLLHNCYLRVERSDYNYLLFRVETFGRDPFPAQLIAPDVDPDVTIVADEGALRSCLRKLFNHPSTTEVVLHMMANFG